MIAADYAMADFIAQLQYRVATSPDARRQLLAETKYGGAEQVRAGFSAKERAAASYNPALMEQYRQARMARPAYEQRRRIKSMTGQQMKLGATILDQMGANQ